MKNLLILFILSISFFACQDVGEIVNPVSDTVGKKLYKDFCGTPKVVEFLAGQHINVGSITVGNDKDNLYVIYKTTGDWYMNQTHLYVGSLEGLPKNKSGNPIPGQFPYKTTHTPRVQEFTYEIPLSSLTPCFVVAAHAEVVKLDGSGNVIQSETGWGNGTPINPKGNWGTYFDYCVQYCPPPPQPCVIEPGAFRTQTQGGWGTKAEGNNPGTYRDANFAGAFPLGLTVGSTYTLKLTSSQAVQTFLPQGGSPGSLITNYLNPTSTSAGVFAGQVVALTLSVTFDLYDLNFGTSLTNLKDLKIADPSSPFVGWTVQQLLVEANKVLGGQSSSYTASQLNDAVSKVNENFVDGTFVGTFLTCP